MLEVTVQRGARVRTSPRVSVVIPAFKPDWLDDALESVRAQTFPYYEIIVVDDGSPQPVKPARSDDLTLIRHDNAGPGGARNRGVEHARGDLIAFLDADDRWRPPKLERQVALHEAHPELVLSCTDLVHTDGTTTRPAKTVRERAGFEGDRIPFAKLFYENCIACSTTMLRREAFLRTPGMAAHRRMGEDFGLWLRLALLGPVGYLAEPLLERRQHGESLMFESLRDNSWLALEREIYREILDENPELRGRPFVKAALARLEFQGGWTHLQRREWSDARRALARSIWYQPRRPKAWVDLARAFLHVGPLRR